MGGGEDGAVGVDEGGCEIRRPQRVRMVHIGLGAFARAHVFDYTQAINETVPLDEQWGIAAFTGRSPRMADALSAQDNLYTLTVKDASGVVTKVMTPLIASHSGDDQEALNAYVRDPGVSVVTVTVTEGGYRNGVDDGLTDPRLRTPADVADFAIGRLSLALYERFRANAGPISLVSLDNVGNNGDTLGNLLRQTRRAVAGARAEEYAMWFLENVGLVSTVVDRITPRSSAPGPVLPSGGTDRAPVVTEGFHEWVLSDSFVAARPEWERAGAQLVDDLGPFAQRKLLLLNAAHSLMAYAGLARGFTTVREAISDPALRTLVETLWHDASTVIPPDAGDLEEYTSKLIARFSNPYLDHELAQIAEGGEDKMRIRIGPVLFAARRDGWRAQAHEQAVAAWADFEGLSAVEAFKRVLPVDGDDAPAPHEVPLGSTGMLRPPRTLTAPYEENHENR